jgi:hypothetical protein
MQHSRAVSNHKHRSPEYLKFDFIKHFMNFLLEVCSKKVIGGTGTHVTFREPSSSRD